MPCLYIVLVQENIFNPIPTWYLACHTSTLDRMSSIDSNGLDICTYVVKNITKFSRLSFICPSYTIFVSPNILTNLFEETCPYHMKRNKHEMICVCKDWLQKLCKQWTYFCPQRPRWQQKVKVIISQQKPQPSTFHTPPPRLVAKVSDLSVVVIRENCSPWLQRHSLASVRIPRRSRAIPGNCVVDQWSIDKVTPSKGPCMKSAPSQTRQHVYVRLYKPPFASANQRRAAADRPMRSRLFGHFVSSYINGFI